MNLRFYFSGANTDIIPTGCIEVTTYPEDFIGVVIKDKVILTMNLQEKNLMNHKSLKTKFI